MRHVEDVDHDGPSGGELELALEGEPGDQLLRSSTGRTDQDQHKQTGDGDTEEHDPR